MNDDDDTQVYKDDGNALLIAYQSGYYDGKKAAMAQPVQEPVAHFGSAYVNENGVHITTVLGPVAIPQDAKLYTAPPQRTWVEPTGNEWFEWWRVSAIADSTEAEIDFADFLIIAQAVITKLKEKNG